MGLNDKAIATLEQEPATEDHTEFAIERDRMLAILYRRHGDTEKAAGLYQQLLDKPISDRSFWLDGADCFRVAA